MTPRRFLARESREAMLVTADNLAEVAQWCRGSVCHAGDVAYVMTGRRDRHGGAFPVEVGSVLVTDGNRWWDMGAEEFERASREWEEQA